ncbi:hypothetical protein K1719_001539 [Acacia pycnantha]|nr:hypothetical protein K1719_001539 [Acacia pycnantha]
MKGLEDRERTGKENEKPSSVTTLQIHSSTPSRKLMAMGEDNPFLPPEIIINILKRLPVKSLVRFRCVVKDWRNLMKSPYFIEEHHHHSALNNPLLISSASVINPAYSFLFLLRYEMKYLVIERIPAMYSLRRAFSNIIGSCNGLLCAMLGHDGDELLLLNPATREVRQVPTTTINDGSYSIFGWGFGFSPIVRDYKIVRIHMPRSINLDDICVVRAELYSLRTGLWKEIEFGAIRTVRFLSKAVTINGAIFWLGSKGGDHRHMIVSFDLVMEVFTLIPLPSTSYSPIYPIVLDVYENKVAILHRFYAHEGAFIDLWVLEEGSGAHGKSWGWTKTYGIGPMSCCLHPKCFLRNEIVCQKFGQLGNAFHYLVNLTTNNELKKCCLISSSLKEIKEIINYAESLVSMCDMQVE